MTPTIKAITVAGALAGIVLLGNSLDAYDKIVERLPFAPKDKFEELAGDYYTGKLTRLEAHYFALLRQAKRGIPDPKARAQVHQEIHSTWQRINQLRVRAGLRPFPPPYR